MPERLPPPFDLDQRPLVAVFRSPVFNASETFVRAQAAGLVRYQPLVVGFEDKGHVPPALAGRVLLRPSAARLRDFAPVLVHAHFGPDGLRALPLAARLGLPLVTSLRGYDLSRSTTALLRSGRPSWINYALFRRRLMRRGDLFLAACEALRRRAVARGFPEERTRTHHNGVDLDLFPAGPGGADTILFVGRLVEKKGLATLLRAFAVLRAARPSARLVVIGEGPLRAALERSAGDGVRFLGWQPVDAVAGWMRRATVLAAPSVAARDGDAEGLPNVLVEAAASALPAVGTDHEGIPEAIVEGETGFLVPEHDAAALAARLAALLDSRALRDRMGAAARALAEARFDFARQMQRLEEIYDELRAGRCG
jgi:glycosyltransferase involved in cell wall biosynthesis